MNAPIAHPPESKPELESTQMALRRLARAWRGGDETARWEAGALLSSPEELALFASIFDELQPERT